MTWTPETNRVPWGIMTSEEQAAIKAAKHGWEGWVIHLGIIEVTRIDFLGRFPHHHVIYRALPAPAAKPPIDPAIWRFLPKWVMHMAMDANLEWWGYKDKPERFEEFWYSKEGVHNLDQFVIPSTGFDWHDSCIARPKGM
jgi:hypothetical protein